MRWKLLSVLLLGLMVLSSFGSASVPNNEVSPALAEKVARSYVQWIAINIPDFKEWKGATLGKSVTYYFLNGEKSAYEFAVFKNGKNVGFIFISARRDMPPVLEFNKAKPPSWNLKNVKELAEKKGYTTGKLLYYGALTYSVDIGNGKAIRLKDLKVRKYPMKVELKFNKEKARKEWTRFEGAYPKAESDFGNITPLATTPTTEPIFNTIEGVPTWTSEDSGGSDIQYPYNVGPASDPLDDWDGCAPIAASMDIGYYEPQMDKEVIIDILHYTMGTFDEPGNPGVTYTSRIASEIDQFFTEYYKLYYNGIVNEPINYAYSAWTKYSFSDEDIISEIDTGHPFVLSMYGAGESLDGEGPYGDHSVTGVGYWGICTYYNEGGIVTKECNVGYIEIHDTWYSGEAGVHWIANGNWEDADMTCVRSY